MTAPVARRGFSEEAIHALNERQGEPAWMQERRLDAWKIYESLPMPTRQDEEWRRTDLRAAVPAELNIVPLRPAHGIARLWATHPPLERRLAALERMEARLQAAR